MPIQKVLSKRNVWMGFAILWVVFFHTEITSTKLPITLFKLFGYGGVDIFIFSSGIGCWYSLDKNPEPLSFIRRRASRLLPIYYAALPFWLACCMITKSRTLSVLDVIGNILCVQWFTAKGNSVNWYVSAIWVFYFAAPYLYAYLRDRSFTLQLAGLLLTVLIYISFADSLAFLVGVSRLPLFYMGMMFAERTKKAAFIRKRTIVLLFVSSAIGAVSLLHAYKFLPSFLWTKGLWWAPYILITPGLCLAMSMLSLWLEKIPLFEKILAFLELCGKRSFEILLAQLVVFDVVLYLIEEHTFAAANTVWFLSLLPVALSAALLSLLSDRLRMQADPVKRSGRL